MSGRIAPRRVIISEVHLGLRSHVLVQLFLVLVRDPRELPPISSAVAGVRDTRHRPTYPICRADVFFDSGRVVERDV